MKIYLIFSFIGFGLLFSHSETIIKQHVPAELLCLDTKCLKTITMGKLIKDVNIANQEILKKNTLVDIIALSADTANSLMKIKFGTNNPYIDSSLVQMHDSPSSFRFLRVKNTDTILNPSTSLDEDSSYKSTAKDHQDNGQTFSDSQRQSNAIDIDLVDPRSHDQVIRQETADEKDSDEVEDDTLEVDNDEDESNDNNSTLDTEVRDTASSNYGETNTTDFSFESTSENVSQEKVRKSMLSNENEPVNTIAHTKESKDSIDTKSFIKKSASKQSDEVTSDSEQSESDLARRQSPSDQSHHVEGMSGTEDVKTGAPPSPPPPTVPSKPDKMSEKVSSDSEQSESDLARRQSPSDQSHHVEGMSKTEDVKARAPPPPPTVPPSPDKMLEKVSSDSEHRESDLARRQSPSDQSHHVEGMSGTEDVKTGAPPSPLPPTVPSKPDKMSEKVLSDSEQSESDLAGRQSPSDQSHHVEGMSKTEDVKTGAPPAPPPPTVPSKPDKMLEKVSSDSEQSESDLARRQSPSDQSHHVEGMSGTEDVKTGAPPSPLPPTVPSKPDKMSEKVLSDSEQSESDLARRQSPSDQSHHVEGMSKTEDVKARAPPPPPTVPPSPDKMLEKVSSDSEHRESDLARRQSPSDQSHHVEGMSGTEDVKTGAPPSPPPPTVPSKPDKMLEKVSSDSEQSESDLARRQSPSDQSHHVEGMSKTEDVKARAPPPPPTVPPSPDKMLEKVSSDSEHRESDLARRQSPSDQSHHVEGMSGTEDVKTGAPPSPPPPTVPSKPDKMSEKVLSDSEQSESDLARRQSPSDQSHHVEGMSGTEDVKARAPPPPPTVPPSPDKMLEKVSSDSEQSGSDFVKPQRSFLSPSSKGLDNDSQLETTKSVYNDRQGGISSDFINVENIGKFHSLDVNNSISSTISQQISKNQLFDPHIFPVHIGLIQCIYWAANVSFDQTYLETVRSPFSRLFVNGLMYFFSIANFSLQYFPENSISSLDNILLETFSLPLNFIIAWMIFIVHLLFVWNLSKVIHSILSKYIFPEKYTSPSLAEYIKLEEYSIQLASQLSDMEESNSHLSKWANSLSCNFQNLQEEYTTKISEMTLSVDDSHESCMHVQSELNHLKNAYNLLEQSLRLKLTDKEEIIHELNTEINHLKQLNSDNDNKWQKNLLDLEETNRQSIEKLKEELEQLYSQANSYYNRMKTMQSDMEMIKESRKASEEKLLTKEAEFQSLLATFNTLKGLELILEQESFSQQSKINSIEEREVDTIENMSNVICCTLEDDLDVSDKSSVFSESILSDSNEKVHEKTTEKSKLREKLSLLLDVGRLHAQIRLKDEQIKTEESKTKSEHDLRVQVESKLEEIEKENSTLKSNLIQTEQEKNAFQTKLDILSDYFKERELELQRDLGKHVVVGSESSEALMHSRKRNQELEGEVKILRDQMTALRRELAETERTSRRQISELDKRSHENWLAARASEHQIQDLREENSSLRQKLIESENNALRSSLHNFPGKIDSSSREKLMNILPRPFLPPGFLKNTSLRGDVHSQSRNSMTNLSSQQPITEANPFPFIPPPPLPPPGMMPFPGGLQNDTLSPPPPPLLPGFPPVQMNFPPGFLPPPPIPPFAPVMKTLIDQNKQTSSRSSISGSLK
ncbi:unnamed protein product [Schistosoma turkestanicum]|nr:unnamed protein product [Schistosoma turkestanicum]